MHCLQQLMYHVQQWRNVMMSIAACVLCKHWQLKLIISQVPIYRLLLINTPLYIAFTRVGKFSAWACMHRHTTECVTVLSPSPYIILIIIIIFCSADKVSGASWMVQVASVHPSIGPWVRPFKRDTRHLKKWLISAQRHQMHSSCPFLKSPSSRIKKGTGH
jgi:hypothetical protein